MEFLLPSEATVSWLQSVDWEERSVMLLDISAM
jgi:hypothetical protein